MNAGMNTNLWQRKLMAFLHDPPEKAYDFTQAHEESAASLMNLLGVDPEAWRQHRQADWSSSAADRLPFPAPGKACEKRISFKHPLSGQEVFTPGDFPAQEAAWQAIKDVVPAFSPADPKVRFWLVWRLWMQFTAEHARGREAKASHLPYLPADTRIPDHSIWNHMSMASALEAARGEDGTSQPAFLLFQLGPVQDFIRQARSTRDLWSGSYLLSWLMAHALQAVAEKLGPDSVISPSLRGQPLFDWLNQDKLKQAQYEGADSFWSHLHQHAFEELVLTPVLPNRFLAVVPADFKAQDVVQALEEEWGSISEACASWLAGQGCPVPHEDRWDFQAGHFWQASWQLWPWPSVAETVRLFKQTPVGKTDPIELALKVARKAQADGGYAPNEGSVWSAQYQLCQHRLDARRQTREFVAWQGVENAVKDDYSGKEEEVISKEWLAKARHAACGFLFRKEEEHLGAVNLIKRVWHKAYLAGVKKLNRATESFDSVPAVAAEPWKRALLDKLQKDGAAWPSLLEFQNKVLAEAEALDFVLPRTTGEKEWLSNVDAGVCYESTWVKTPGVARALKDLIRKAGVGKPSSYYAVLALDGDEMGQWLSGVKTPRVKNLLCEQALKYFSGFDEGKQWLETHRPLSPSYHLQFSESLANFGLYCARRVVEAHHGRLIYAGGDDVLALLPAEQALACAQGLRMAFQGDAGLAQRYSSRFMATKPGMVLLKDGDWEQGARRPHEPCWPLLVPGPASTVSVGLSIGHIREPLQDMVRAAQEAEHRAKHSLSRDAVAVSLFKRSGEQIEWGTKFIPEPFELLAFLDKHYRAPYDDPQRTMPISGKFPYRICELLRKYGPAENMANWREIARAEVDWAINQLRLKDENLEGGLRSKAHGWLEKALTLDAFYNLFAVEAFIARQGEE